MNNGDGLRVVLWVSGCEHHCKGCQNPVTWNPDDGLVFGKRERKEIFNALKKPYIGGITFSGGDPLHPSNRACVYLLMKDIKQRFPKKTIWVYTGYTWDEIMANKYLPTVMKYVDVLVDGRFEEELKGGGSVQSTFLTDIDQLFHSALQVNEIEGIILNPWNRTIMLDKLSLIHISEPTRP